MCANLHHLSTLPVSEQALLHLFHPALATTWPTGDAQLPPVLGVWRTVTHSGPDCTIHYILSCPVPHGPGPIS